MINPRPYVDMLKAVDIPDYRIFSDAEYASRLARVRGSMAEAGIDVLLVSNTANWAWLTGYDTTMPSCYGVGIVFSDGSLAVHTAELEAPCALANSVVSDVRVYDWYDNRSTAEQLAGVLRDAGEAGRTIGVEMAYPDTFGPGAYDAASFLTLQRVIPESRFEDATQLIMQHRMIKSAQEIEYMKQAGSITWLGLEAALNAAAEGRSDQDMVAAGSGALFANGSELTSIDGMVMVGERAKIGPHMPFKRTTLRQGDSMYLEFTGTYHRYNAPSMRSGVIGAPSPGLQRLADAAIHTLELLIENIRPGRTGHDIAEAVKHGYDPVADEMWFHGAYGYGIGMGMQPTWCEAPVYIAPGVDIELRPGMAFHLPQCVFVPGQYGTGFSESVVVTETGCELLTPGLGRELVIR
ncbi:M24 family metallopeptidase [Leucobacter sp.]